MSRYLTVEEVAEALRVSASWVYKHKNLLGGVRLGDRLWRFPEQDLMARLSEWDVASALGGGTPARPVIDRAVTSHQGEERLGEREPHCRYRQPRG